ncbi:MAG: hypothetical protein KAI33_09115, partial [Elusimicrobiales bacterium]|nr:hypothetical protein [Elusimicrobiales bacterium]
MARKKLGEILIQSKHIDEDQLNKALKFQQQDNCLIGEALVKLRYVTEEHVAMALSRQLGMPYASRENQILNPESGQGLEKIIPEKFSRDNFVIPLFMEEGILAVAMADPTNIILLDNIKLISGMELQIFISTKEQILKVVDVFYQGKSDLIDQVIEGGGEDDGEAAEAGDGLT